MKYIKDPFARFIVGTPRSATTFLSRALNVHPNVASFGETSFWGRSYHPPGPDGTYTPNGLKKLLDDISNHELPVTIGKNEPGYLKYVTNEKIGDIVDKAFSNEISSKLTPADVFCKFCNAITSAEGKSYWVEKTPHHVMWADRIFDAIPNTRLLIVLREPYGFMQSYRRKMEVNYERGERSDIYHPLRCSLVWRSTARATLRLIENHPNKVLFVNTHEIQRDPVEILNKVLSFFDLPPIDWNDYILPSRSTNTFFSGGKKPNLPDVDKSWMNIIAGKEIHKTSFEYIPSTVSTGSFLKSILILPKWFLLTYHNTARIVPGSMLQYLGRWIFQGRLTRTVKKIKFYK